MTSWVKETPVLKYLIWVDRHFRNYAWMTLPDLGFMLATLELHFMVTSQRNWYFVASQISCKSERSRGWTWSLQSNVVISLNFINSLLTLSISIISLQVKVLSLEWLSHCHMARQGRVYLMGNLLLFPLCHGNTYLGDSGEITLHSRLISHCRETIFWGPEQTVMWEKFSPWTQQKVWIHSFLRTQKFSKK